jgi:hypothetical protein
MSAPDLKRRKLNVELSVFEIGELAEALDCYLYEEVSVATERSDGFVYFPSPRTAEYKAGSDEDRERWDKLRTLETLQEKLARICTRETALLTKRAKDAAAAAKNGEK